MRRAIRAKTRAKPRGIRRGTPGALLPLVLVLTVSGPAQAQYQQKIGNDSARCTAGAGPAVKVTVKGIEGSIGTLRVQSYRATEGDWLKKGRWVNRIELPARAGAMVFCVPLPSAGSYAIAVRHDANGNGKTEISSDGGGMSNNPAITIFNLGKPNYRKTAFAVGDGVTAIQITMKYM